MLTSNRGIAALPFSAFAVASAFFIAAPAAAQSVANPAEQVDEGSASGFSVSANTTLASEYRFRGTDLSGGEFAIQGGVDVAHDSGFYIGTWASSLDEQTVGFGSTELDIYGGWSGDVSDGVALDVGVIGYLYPDAGPGDFDYVEVYGSVGYSVGPAETTLGIAYAPDQDSLGGGDNLYVYGEVGVGIPSTPVTLTGRLGYNDGFLTFTNDGKAFDWSIGAEAAIAGTPLSIGAAYVGAEGDIPAGAYDFVDDAFVVTLNASF